MPGVRFVTDSSCDLSNADVDAHQITVVPLSIRFGEEEMADRFELSAADFYKKMDAYEGLPETAAPSPGAFEQAFRTAGANGDIVICLNLSAALSATMVAAQNAAKALEGEIDVRVVDSKSITSGLGTQLLIAAEYEADGAGADEIIATLEGLAPRTRVFGGLDTLENLKKGGRIGNAQALLGNLLSIKPTIDLSSGSVEEAGKVRTRKKQMNFLRDTLMKSGPFERLVVCDGEAPDSDEFAALIEAEVGAGNYTRTTIGPVIGTHGGPRMIGLTWLTA